MKYKGERSIKEVPLINLLKPDDLKKLNAVFKTNYQPQRMGFVRIIEAFKFKELRKLMQEKPKGGGYGV